METAPSSGRKRYVAIVSIVLITAALIAGMAGCVGVKYDLTIASTAGGGNNHPWRGRG